jgi:hypothetical protein
MCKRVAGREMCPRKIIFLIMSVKSDTLCAGSDPATLGISIMFAMTKLLKRSTLLPATAFASALMLAACGSGGGSSSPTNSDSPPANTATPDGYWLGAVGDATAANTLGGLILKDQRFWLISSTRVTDSGSSTIKGMFTGTMGSSYNAQTKKYEFSTSSSTYFQSPRDPALVAGANPGKSDLPLKGGFVPASSMDGFVYSGTDKFAGISLPKYEATLYTTVPSLTTIQGNWTPNKGNTPAVFFSINNGSFTNAQVLQNCFANGTLSVVSGANAYDVKLSFPDGCAVINQAPGAAYSGIALPESVSASRLTLALVRADQNQALFLLFDR